MELMNALHLWLAELKNIAVNKKLLISVIAVLMVPIMYAGLFLYAFWDPYDKMDQLPVAIVNEDTGADYSGTSLELGNELIKNLKKNNSFKFEFVNEKDGYHGIEDRKYYMLVKIPEDFSENATTLLDENPQKLDLIYVPNESFNFLSAQVGDSAVVKIKSSISAEITKTYSETIFDKVIEMADGYETAADGAGQLSNGIADVGDGANKVKENLETLASKQIEYSDGVNQVEEGSRALASGTKELSTGLTELQTGEKQLYDGTKDAATGAYNLLTGLEKYNKGLNDADKKFDDIVSGSAKLHAATTQLKNGTASLEALGTKASQLATGTKQLNDGIVQLNKSLAPFLASLPQESRVALQTQLSQLEAGSTQLASETSTITASTDQLVQLATGISQIDQGAAALASGTEQYDKEALAALVTAGAQLQSGAGELNEGENKLVQGFSQLDAGLNKVDSGSTQLASGADQLASGTEKLADGSTQLADGAQKLANGSEDLTGGVSKLEDGATEFKQKLDDVVGKTAGLNPNKDTYEMMADPVEIKDSAIHEVPNYGTGFTPYFLSLGLFVGALIITIVFQIHDPIARPKTFLSWFASKYGTLVTIGIVQALLADVILLMGLKLEVESVGLFVLFSIITSLTFMSIIQFLTTTMGDPGRFIAIVLLIFQLTSSAGTFPIELNPGLFQSLNGWMPMTYTVQGFKAIVSSGDFSFAWTNVGYLLIYIGISVCGTLIYMFFKHKKAYRSNLLQTQEGTI